MKKIKITNYNDGFIKVYEEEQAKTSFGAKKNTKDTSNLNLIVKLAYYECYKRIQDFEFAQANSRTLTLKVKTRLYDKVKSEHKVIINNVLYDIINVDYDRVNREMYLYLEYVREVND